MFTTPKKNNDDEMLTDVMPAVMQAVLEKKRDSRRILVKMLTSKETKHIINEKSNWWDRFWWNNARANANSKRKNDTPNK